MSDFKWKILFKSMNSKKATQEAYEYRNPYGPNVSQFEGDMVEGE